MLKTGLSHGVAVVPNPPKERYNCPKTGAHFEFTEVCRRIERVKKQREEEFSRFGERKIRNEFKVMGNHGTSKRLDQILERAPAEEGKSMTTYQDEASSVEPLCNMQAESSESSIGPRGKGR